MNNFLFVLLQIEKSIILFKNKEGLGERYSIDEWIKSEKYVGILAYLALLIAKKIGGGGWLEGQIGAAA